MAEELQSSSHVDAEDTPVQEEGRRPRSAIRRRILLLVKLGVTAGLCAWIVSLVDWQLFWNTLRDSTLWILGVVVLLRVGGIAISSEKWRQLLAIHGLTYKLGDLLRWYFVALFLNHFLPTSIGGDGYRIYKTWENRRGRSYAVVAVFVERLTGLAALALVGYAAAVVIFLRTQDPFAGSLIAIITGGGIAGVLCIWAFRRFRLLGKLAQPRFFPKVLLRLGDFSVDFRNHPRGTLRVVAISFLFHVNKLAVIWLVLYALGATTNFLELAVVVVTVDVIGLLPISLGGLGLVEGSFIYAIGHYGVGQETALAAMLLMRVLLLPLSFLGASFYFMDDRSARPLPTLTADEFPQEEMFPTADLRK